MRDLAELRKFAFDLGSDGGAYKVHHNPTNAELRIIASTGGGWDHISVSLHNRCPNWAEMEFAKHMFFKPDEVAMQLHVPASDHINVHQYCLHIWRPQLATIPMPPSIFVG